VVIEARTAAKRGHVHQVVFELRVKEFESSASPWEKSRRGRTPRGRTEHVPHERDGER
jgi:hypothetical protein